MWYQVNKVREPVIDSEDGLERSFWGSEIWTGARVIIRGVSCEGLGAQKRNIEEGWVWQVLGSQTSPM